MEHILLVGSKSPSRAMLLTESGIPFKIVAQNADESQCGLETSFAQRVQLIALHKMEHIVLPVGIHNGEICFVLTADTMVQDAAGNIYGKPRDRDEAIAMVRLKRAEATACTAFCLDRKIWQKGTWKTEERISQIVTVSYVFDVPDAWLDTYFRVTIGQNCAGGGAVEGFGSQFLRSVNGSHSALIGLPMYELREALEKLGFFGK